MEQALLFFDFSKNIEQDVYQKASSACPRQICSCSVNIADEGITTGSLSVSFSFSRYYVSDEYDYVHDLQGTSN